MLTIQSFLEETVTEEHCHELIKKIRSLLLTQNLKIVAAESLTGGWLGKLLTDIEGSSEWFEGSLVTYSYTAKTAILSVNPTHLTKHGAINTATATAMITGLQSRLPSSTVRLALTGLTSLDIDYKQNLIRHYQHDHQSKLSDTLLGILSDNSQEHGHVFIAWQIAQQNIECRELLLTGKRNAIRLQSIYILLYLLLQALSTSSKNNDNNQIL